MFSEFSSPRCALDLGAPVMQSSKENVCLQVDSCRPRMCSVVKGAPVMNLAQDLLFVRKHVTRAVLPAYGATMRSILLRRRVPGLYRLLFARLAMITDRSGEVMSVPQT